MARTSPALNAVLEAMRATLDAERALLAALEVLVEDAPAASVKLVLGPPVLK